MLLLYSSSVNIGQPQNSPPRLPQNNTPPAQQPNRGPNPTPAPTPASPQRTPAQEAGDKEQRQKNLETLKNKILYANSTERRQAIRRAVTLPPEDRTMYYPVLVKIAREDLDPGVRESSIRALGEMDYREAEPIFIGALSDSGRDVIQAAVTALNRLKIKTASPRLDELMKKEDFKINNTLLASIIRTLGIFEYRDAAAYLMQKARDSETNREIKSTILLYLGAVKSIEAVDYIITLLNNEEEDLSIRSNAAHALGKIGDKKAVAPLKEILEKIRALAPRDRSARSRLRLQTLTALIRLGDTSVQGEIIAAAQDDDPNVRLRAVNQLAELKVASAKDMLTYISERDPSAQVKRAAKRALEILAGGNVEIGPDDESDNASPPAEQKR